MKILLIDDDKVFSEPLVWRLNHEKHEVTYCQSIEDILDKDGKMKVPRPDCILLDIMMPRGSYSKSETDAGKDTGLRLLTDIYKKNPNIPVVVITARGDLDEIELRKKFGSLKNVLVKPVTPSLVVDVLREIFPRN